MPWGEGLAILDLPSANPAAEMGQLKHVAGDSFRMKRDDGSLGTEYIFQRNAAGQVVGVNRWGALWARITP